MLKFIFVLVATAAVFVEGGPVNAADLVNAAKSGNWELFQNLRRGSGNPAVPLKQEAQIWQPAVAAASFSNFPLDGKVHEYSHSVSAFKQWSKNDGKYTEQSGGAEIINNDGNITRRVFKP